MKLYMITSNKYTKHVCPINVHFLNKYWTDLDITIVGYDAVLELKDLPSNVNVICLGNQEEYGREWTTALIPFFKDIPEDYFALNFDDHILMNRVNLRKLKIIEDQFKAGNVDKAQIGGGIDLTNTRSFSNDLLLFKQGIDYRLSLHPAIWTKKYFLKYLRPNMTAWDFELKLNFEAAFDGAKIINLKYNYPQEPHLYSYFELYTKGKLNINHLGQSLIEQPSYKFFDTADLQYLADQIHRGGVS